MKVTEGRRLAAILGAYIGIFSLRILVPEVGPYLVLLGIAFTALFSFRLLFREKRKVFLLRKSILILLMVIAVASACIRGANYFEKTEMAAARYTDGAPHAARGYVTKISYEKNYGSCYEIRLLTLDQRETDLGVMLSLPYNGGLSVSDIVAFEGIFSPPEEDSVLYRKADGIFLSVETESAEVMGVQETDTSDFFENIRLSVQRNFETYMEPEEAGFATAILTGNRENLNGSVKLAFSRIGISHILAVSGLHLAIIVGGLDLLCRLIAIPRKLKNLILILCACLFAYICGLSASIVRATIMLSFLYVADTVGERHDSLTSLFVAIFLIVVFRPNAVYDVGMWMSFLATFGIVVTAPAIPQIRTKKCPHILRKLFNSISSLVCITVTATFFTLPVTYIAFSGISLLSPLANLLFVFLTQIILYFLIALTFLGGIPFLASPIAKIAQALIAFVCKEADRLSDIKGVYVSLRYPFLPALITVLILGVITVLAVRKIRTGYLFAVFAFCLAFYAVGCFGYIRAQGDSSYVYLETDGKSDAVGIVSGGETVIVDISTGGYSVLSEAVEHIEDFCACEIDVLVLTHYHPYHLNTLEKLMSRIKIHKILLPVPTSEQDMDHYASIYGQLGDLVEIEVYPTDGTQSLRIGNAILSLPETERLARSTHPVVRFSVSMGEKGMSYLGESATEKDLSDSANAVVVFGSHGPSAKHIFDSSPIADAELIVFADRSHAELTDTERIHGEIAFPEDYGGWIKILFE